MITSDVFQHYGVEDGLRPFFFNDWSTYFSFWTSQVLDEFAKYISGFYSRPRIEIFRDIKKSGSPRLVPAAPEGWPRELGKPRHFADMHMLSLYLQKNNLQRYMKYARHLANKNMETQDRPVDNLALTQGRVCRPIETWENDVVLKKTRTQTVPPWPACRRDTFPG